MKEQKSFCYDPCDVNQCTRQLTLMSYQFSSIRHSSYYLYRDVIYLDYPADEPVVSTLISLSALLISGGSRGRMRGMHPPTSM